jgi:hypothetical protein
MGSDVLHLFPSSNACLYESTREDDIEKEIFPSSPRWRLGRVVLSQWSTSNYKIAD